MDETINILDLNINFGGLIKDAAETKKKIDELKKAIKELEVAEGDNTEEIIKQSAQLKNLQTQYRGQTKVIESYIDIKDEEVLTIEQARKALSAVSIEWAREAKLTGENSEATQKLADKKKELTERLKALEASTGDNRRNVGNYTESLKQALGGVNLFGKGVDGLWNTMSANPMMLIINILSKLGKEVSKAQSIVDAFNAVWLPLHAIMQRVIGLVQDVFLKVFKDASGQTKSFGQILKDLGNTIVQNVINRFKSVLVIGDGVVKFLKGDFKEGLKTATDGLIQMGTGIENATDKMAAFSGQLEDAFNKGQQIDKLRKEIETLDINLKKSEETRRAQIEKNKLLAEDESISTQKRISLIKEAAALEEQIEAEKQKILDKRIEQMKLQQTLNDTDRAAQQELAELEGQRARASVDKFTRQKELVGKLKALTAQERAVEKAAADQRKKEQQEALDREVEIAEEKIKLFEIANKSKIKDDEKLTSELVASEIKRQSDLKELQIKYFEAQKKAGRISQVELQVLLDSLDEQFKEFTTGLTSKLALQAIDELTQNIIEGQTKLARYRDKQGGFLISPEQIENEKGLINQIFEAEKIVLDERYKNKLITEQEYQAELFAIQKNAKDQIAQLEQGYLTQGQTQEAVNFANKMEILKLQNEDEFVLRQMALDRQYQIELENAEKTGADVTLINEKYRELNKELEQQSQQARLQTASNYLTAFAQLVGENTLFGKLAASAAAVINTWQAVTEALKAPTLPQRIAAVAFATATGLASVIKINNTKVPTAPEKKALPKFGKGGKFAIAGGRLHTQGGTKYFGEDGNIFEVERGENMYILNRAASAAVNQLSSVNQLYGGHAFEKPTRYLADGGLVNMQTPTNTLPESIVVDVKDIIRETDIRVKVIDSTEIN